MNIINRVKYRILLMINFFHFFNSIMIVSRFMLGLAQTNCQVSKCLLSTMSYKINNVNICFRVVKIQFCAYTYIPTYQSTFQRFFSLQCTYSHAYNFSKEFVFYVFATLNIHILFRQEKHEKPRKSLRNQNPTNRTNKTFQNILSMSSER